MPVPIDRSHYDVVIAGARCAGAATAMLLARRGLRVLAVDPSREGSDTLSTHALMRGAVLQLHRWGLLESIRSSGAPPIRKTSFHYGSETIEVPIKEKDGVDALYAPRRTVLDPVLTEAARAAGAEVVHGVSVTGLLRSDDGRVRGATISAADQSAVDVTADLVIGADGTRSRVARILQAEVDYSVPTRLAPSTDTGTTFPSRATTGSTTPGRVSARSLRMGARRAYSLSFPGALRTKPDPGDRMDPHGGSEGCVGGVGGPRRRSRACR